MATLKTPTKSIPESPGEKVPPLLSLENVENRTKKISKEIGSNPSLALIDIQQQPMTILNSLSIVKQENNIQT